MNEEPNIEAAKTADQQKEKYDPRAAFMRCRMPDGSIWRVCLEALITKVPGLLVAQETPWQKRWEEMDGDAGDPYTIEDAQKQVWDDLLNRDMCELIEMLDWDDVKDAITIEVPPTPPKELWERWKTDALEWTDGGRDLLELSLPNE